MEKLKQLYNEYDFDFTDESVKAEVAKILAENFDRYNNAEVYRQCFGIIDLTSLNATDTDDSIGTMMEKVNEFKTNYPDMPNVAAVCIYPALIGTAKATLEAEDVNIAAVSAGFPSSQTFIEAKVAETALAVMAGANEIDVVISLGKFFSGFHTEVMDELKELNDACSQARLKVILESGLMHNTKEIKQASLIAISAGADFIKTSTGKTEPAATPEAAYVMCQTIKEYYEKTGEKVGFKAAGGISTTRQAVEYYTIVRSVLGEEWLDKNLFRFGASRLADNLLTDIYGKEIHYFK